MEWLSRKAIFKNMIFNLIPWNLECVGVYDFIVIDKKIIKLKKSESTNYLLNISTVEGKYSSIVRISKERYYRFHKDKPYGSCCVIKNMKHQDIYNVVAGTSPVKAKRWLVIKAWGIMLFLAIVLGLTIFTILYYIFQII